MKLLFDVNLSRSLVERIRELGIEAESWLDVGDRAAADTEIASYASTHARVIVTKDLDFGEILAHGGKRSPSVLVRVTDTLSYALAERLVQLCEAERDALEKGALVALDETRARIRLLPIP